MRASSPFSFEAGISTVSCAAWIALRTRVRKSAIGSVMDTAGPPLACVHAHMRCVQWTCCGACVSWPPLPGRLGHPRDLAVVGELAQADAAQPELAIHRSRSPAAVAPSIGPRFEFRRGRLLEAQPGLGHPAALSCS